jgi:hypothetical protein
MLLKRSGDAGPFDDEHRAHYSTIEGQQEKEQRLNETMEVIANECPWLYRDGSTGLSPHLVDALKLFSNFEVHVDAMKRLNIEPKNARTRKVARLAGRPWWHQEDNQVDAPDDVIRAFSKVSASEI